MFYSISRVCKSWCSAVLDVLFPSTGLLDLTKVDTYPECLRKEYMRFLKILLDTRPKAQWHTFVPPHTVWLKEHAILYIAQRSPCLKFLHMNILRLDPYHMAFPYWKNLKEYSCPIFMLRGSSDLISCLGNYCKNLQHLGLCGIIGSETASFIVKHLLELESLSLKKSSLTLDALLIFDGHAKLRILDLEHCLFVDAEVLKLFYRRAGVKAWLLKKPGTKAKKWNEEIHEKVSGNKRYIHCEEALCLECSWAY
ncbi:hypothetical protein AQUCO_05800139v1 [Aquilegia coerulea]|uniref:F-box domain-containing protein n=1 Tax=Aquilegia coerulea TaxID=218851 RepID=A0A2G5CEZ7_AQUCA|nr:hypothetical protein AQUCO_05800139v1 [Aquilegia coerulea]